jgi:hypothetical protein
MTYQDHVHRGMWSIIIANVERSPDIEVPGTVDDDQDPRDSRGALMHGGHLRTRKARSTIRPSTRIAAIVRQSDGTLKLNSYKAKKIAKVPRPVPEITRIYSGRDGVGMSRGQGRHMHEEFTKYPAECGL